MFSVGYTPSIMYATGIAFARLGANPTQFLTNPFTYIEIAAIGYAFVTSIFTIIGLYKRQYRQTARLLVRAIGVSAIILFISATLEIIDIHGTVILSFLNVIPEWAQILLTVDILFLFPRYYKQYIENKVKKHWKLR
jgi:hypothetical protein